MPYILRKFDQTSGLQGGITQQVNQYFRANPYLSVVQAQVQRPGNRGGGQNYSLVLIMRNGGQRMFAAEFVGNQGAFAWSQMNSFFNLNQGVIPYQVLDTSSPDKIAGGRTRLLVLYSALGETKIDAGVAFMQGSINAGSTGQGERVGVVGNTLELLAVTNIGDAVCPSGARGVLLRSRISGLWSCVCKRTYGGSVPMLSVTTPYPALPSVTPCCGQTNPPTVTSYTTPTSVTTATVTTSPSSTTTSGTTTSLVTSTPPTVPPGFTPVTPTTPPSTTAPTGPTTTPTPTPTTTNPVPPTVPPTAPTNPYTAPPNGFCYTEYGSNYDCMSSTWSAPFVIQTVCAAVLPSPMATWSLNGTCSAHAYFTSGSTCQVGGP